MGDSVELVGLNVGEDEAAMVVVAIVGDDEAAMVVVAIVGDDEVAIVVTGVGLVVVLVVGSELINLGTV